MSSDLKIQIVKMPPLGGEVKGKKTLPSKPFQMKAGEGKRWTGKTDLAETFRKARESL